MSRFFHGGSSDSETETSSDDFSSSENEELENNYSSGQAAPRSAFSKFLKDDDESSDEDSGKRVVRSAKEKTIEELRSISKSIDSCLFSEDWTTIQNDYDRLIKLISKSLKILNKNGYPGFLIKCLVELEDELIQLTEDKDARKKLNASDAKAVNALRQKMRKHDSTLEKEMEKYKKNPVADEDEESEDSDEDDTESEEETESENESDDSEDFKAASANKWKKSTAVTSKPVVGKKDLKKEKKAVTFSAASKADSSASAEVKKGDEAEFTTENLYTKLREIRETRGKRGTDKNETVRTIEKLLKVAVTPIQKARVMMALISAKFDIYQSPATSQSFELWKSTENDISILFELIEKNKDIIIDENADEPEDEKKSDEAEVKTIRGNMVSLVSRLDTEFGKCLQSSDPHTTEYVDRLKDEILLYSLILKAEQYLMDKNDKNSLVMIRILRLEHIYYKYNNVITKIEENVRAKHPLIDKLPLKSDADILIHDLCVFLYQNAPDRIRTRAILYHVYHHALNKRYTQARDLLLMSHLQETISKADVSTQVLYNRALAQIGLCAFRSGLMKECHSALSEIVSSLKAKDLLSQGTPISKQYGSEGDKKDKQNILPFHMHINLELLETVQLTSSMLLDIPLLVLHGQDHRRRNISKHFKRLYDFCEKQAFTGPPESSRDYVMHASKAFAEGDWKKCAKLISAIKIWDLIPDSGYLREILTEKIKEEGLRTYVLTYGYHYESIGMDQLSKLFELDMKRVESIVTKLIISEEFSALIDKSHSVVKVSNSVQMTKLEYVIGQFTEKGNSMADFNEKFFEIMSSQQSGGRGQGGSSGHQKNPNSQRGSDKQRRYVQQQQHQQQSNVQ